MVQAVAQPVAMTGEGVASNGPSQVNNVEASAPVAAPRPPPMTTQQIAAYRSGEDPDFDPVERRGWWEVDLTQGQCTLQKLLCAVLATCCTISVILLNNCAQLLCFRCLICWCVIAPAAII